MVYLKNEMDSFKIMLENKDERKEESSVQPKNEAPSNDLQNLLVDRWYLLKDMELLKNEIKFQKYRNNIFIISLILLFSFLLILVALFCSGIGIYTWCFAVLNWFFCRFSTSF